jgi:hypothetical protein
LEAGVTSSNGERDHGSLQLAASWFFVKLASRALIDVSDYCIRLAFLMLAPLWY